MGLCFHQTPWTTLLSPLCPVPRKPVFLIHLCSTFLQHDLTLRGLPPFLVPVCLALSSSLSVQFLRSPCSAPRPSSPVVPGEPRLCTQGSSYLPSPLVPPSPGEMAFSFFHQDAEFLFIPPLPELAFSASFFPLTLGNVSASLELKMQPEPFSPHPPWTPGQGGPLPRVSRSRPRGAFDLAEWGGAMRSQTALHLLPRAWGSACCAHVASRPGPLGQPGHLFVYNSLR